MGDINNLGVFSYKEIEPLTDQLNGPILVRKNDTKEFFVKKCYPLYLKENLITLQKITHLNLPKIQEIVIEEGQLYLYEEFIHGKTLAEIIKSSDVMGTKAILTLTLEVLEALTALHSKGLVHRDVKPGNIMLTNDGVLKLIDFDAIRVVDDEKETDTVQLGTVGFASPEQFGFAQTDARSDLYALGVVINICSIKEYPKDQLSSDPFLHDIIVKATNLDPKNRYQSAVEMKADIIESEKRFKNTAKNAKVNIELARPKIEDEISLDSRQQNAKLSIGSFFRKYMPGFRTGQPWKMTLAIIYYVFVAIGLPGNIYEGETVIEKLLLTLEGSILFILPVLLFMNFMNFHEKIPLLNSKKNVMRGIGYSLLIVSWLGYYGLFLFVTHGGAKR
ncbi:serine/threonine protein kinase [Enterococcus caccae]|uniref:non-specific serine/threonine protein kinase n=1 Tax=Enterococcus caccae ATCC BAA-1240 TaxID=1158612 RepID=R3TY88_9ENTE|nr:serine/threonine-protein kinase [Enterococcus caccae]EOL46549.1 hypothetical protein UC7_01518 [Enterococcus caccae ATCC BAA-1240]EOT60918.1 hypothetical protein I580_01820 [Enterococcus caccae ATCC BAA-1240]OJG26249.1 hypothetical protein RU98_GL000751 [Enterococcus caccae]